MRIKELSEITGFRKETIHYYTREELLPKTKKTNVNQAEYSTEHIDRLVLIKSLRKNLFMSLSAIKKLIRRFEEKQGFCPDKVLIKKLEYFNPFSQLIEEEFRGEADFCELIGLSPDRLTHFEKCGILSPRTENGDKVYSYNDFTLGRILGDMRKNGFGVEHGFGEDTLRMVKDQLQDVTDLIVDHFFDVYQKTDESENIDEKINIYVALLNIFITNLFAKLGKGKIQEKHYSHENAEDDL